MQKDDATWLRTAYALTAALTAFVFWKFFMFTGLKAGWLEKFEASYNVVSVLVSIVCGCLFVWWLGRSQERHDFLLASIAELRRVQWPTWENTKKLTMVVCIVVAIFSVILTVFDVAWAKVLKLLLA